MIELVLLATATLRWTYPDHRIAFDDCNALGDTLLSLDSVRVVRQLPNTPWPVTYWQASARGLEGTQGTLTISADTTATYWLYTKAAKSRWSCESNPVGVGSYPLDVPHATSTDTTTYDVQGRKVHTPLPWGVRGWRKHNKESR